MNQEASESSGKPVLNAESFQRLLAAAYLLQVHRDHTDDEWAQLQPTVADRARAFAAGAIVQRRTPRRTHFSVAQPSTPAMTNISANEIVEAQHTAADPVVVDRISADRTAVDHDLLGRSEVLGQSPRSGGRMRLLGGMASGGSILLEQGDVVESSRRPRNICGLLGHCGRVDPRALGFSRPFAAVLGNAFLPGGEAGRGSPGCVSTPCSASLASIARANRSRCHRRRYRDPIPSPRCRWGEEAPERGNSRRRYGGPLRIRRENVVRRFQENGTKGGN